MADKSSLHTQSREYVAYLMARDIALEEGIKGNDYRQKFLQIYAECLKVTKGGAPLKP